MRRKAYEDARDAIIAQAEDLALMIEELKCKMEEYYDERSEKWQESEKGEAWQDVINDLETAYDSANDLVDIPEFPEAG